MTKYEIIENWFLECQNENKTSDDKFITESDVLKMLAKKYQKVFNDSSSDTEDANFTYHGLMLIAKIAYEEGIKNVDFSSQKGFYCNITFEEWWNLVMVQRSNID